MTAYQLKPNILWPEALHIPNVSVETMFTETMLRFIFEVSEHTDCFRQLCTENGQPCWQDSCVEVFLHSPRDRGYFNFECNSAGFCLGEFGQSRSPRRQFRGDEYKAIKRTVLSSPQLLNDEIHWMLQIEIPRDFIGLGVHDCVMGNLYKCASGAIIPHYLSAFPITSETPDFHRPECFREIQNTTQS